MESYLLRPAQSSYTFSFTLGYPTYPSHWTHGLAPRVLDVSRDYAQRATSAPARNIYKMVDFPPDLSRLFDFQQEAVKWLRLPEHDRALLAFEQRLGKAQPLTARVATPSGWRQIGDLRVGDEVIGSDGRPTLVTGIFPQGELDVYEVVCDDGAKTTCSEDHLWRVQTRNDRARKTHRVLSLKQLMLKSPRDKWGHRWFIPVARPVQLSHKDFKIHPYLMGALIANGSIERSSLTHHGTDEQRDQIRPLLPPGFRLSMSEAYEHDAGIVKDHDNKAYRHSLLGTLEAMGLLGTFCETKFIPDEYMTGSVEQRTALLQGLLDNDGCISADGATIEYNTVSPKLAPQVIALVRSLGGCAWMSTRIPTYVYLGERKNGQMDHRVRMVLPHDVPPFLVPSKAGRDRERYQPRHAIESYERVGKAECVCIRVASPDSLYVTDDYILTHNTPCSLRALPRSCRGIIVCPVSLRLAWRDAINPRLANPAAREAGWRPDLRPRVVSSGGDLIPSPGEVVITNYEALPDPFSRTKLISANLYDVNVILDEAQAVCNVDAQRTQKVRALVRQTATAWALSGTPMPGTPEHLWGLLETLNLHKKAFKNHKAFLRMFGGHKRKGLGSSKYEFTSTTLDAETLAPAREALKAVMLRRRRRDVYPDMPQKVYTDLPVEIESASPVIDDAEREWQLLGATKLPPLEKISKARTELARLKIPMLMAEVQRHEEAGLPLLVFSAHVEPIAALMGRPGWDIITGSTKPYERHEVVRKFQAGELHGVAITIKAGGQGITLPRAADEIFVDLEWNPSDNEQAEDRAVSILAQYRTRPINITRLIVDHPLDRRLFEILGGKSELIEGTIG